MKRGHETTNEREGEKHQTDLRRRSKKKEGGEEEEEEEEEEKSSILLLHYFTSFASSFSHIPPLVLVPYETKREKMSQETEYTKR